jgi:hypothetical protein
MQIDGREICKAIYKGLNHCSVLFLISGRWQPHRRLGLDIREWEFAALNTYEGHWWAPLPLVSFTVNRKSIPLVVTFGLNSRIDLKVIIDDNFLKSQSRGHHISSLVLRPL